MGRERDYRDVVDQLRQHRDDRDWAQFHRPKDLAIAVSTEAAELLEHFLWRDTDVLEEHLATARAEVLEEIADVAIYLVYLCDALRADVLEVVARKLEVNARRHGVDITRGRSRPDG
jgi:dCTP diphosphatase